MCHISQHRLFPCLLGGGGERSFLAGASNEPLYGCPGSPEPDARFGEFYAHFGEFAGSPHLHEVAFALTPFDLSVTVSYPQKYAPPLLP